jgi:hypothetical protein
VLSLVDAHCGHRRVPKLTQHMERISALPKTQQKFVMQMIEMALAQASTQGAAR